MFPGGTLLGDSVGINVTHINGALPPFGDDQPVFNSQSVIATLMHLWDRGQDIFFMAWAKGYEVGVVGGGLRSKAR